MTILIPDLGNTNVKLRYKEEFLSTGVNEKAWGVLRRGILRGFNLTPAGALTVTLGVNAETGDSMAVIEDSDGLQFRALLTGPSGVASLATYAAGDVVVLVLEVVYTLGGATEFRLDSYLEADYKLLADVEFKCVVGEVTIPAGGVIAAADISYNYRSYATVGAPLGHDEFPRGGLSRAAMEGVTDSCENLIVTNYDDVSVGDVTARAIPETAFPTTQNDSVNVYHFELVEAAVEKFAAFYFPVTSKVPVYGGQRVYFESWFRLVNVAYKAGWGGTNALRFVAVFHNGVNNIETQVVDLTASLAGPPYTTTGYDKASHSFVVPAAATYMSVHFEAFGLKKAVAAPLSSFIRLASADLWFETEDPLRGGDAAGGVKGLVCNSLLLTPTIDLPALKAIYTNLGVAFPFSSEKSLPNFVFVSQVETIQAPDVPGTVLYILPTRATGVTNRAAFRVYLSDGVTFRCMTTGDRLEVDPDNGATLRGVGALPARLYSSGAGGAKVVSSGAGDAVLESTGTGSVKVNSAKGIDLAGHVDTEAGLPYHGAMTTGAHGADVFRLRETVGAPAAGIMVKRVEDILACNPAEDILFDEWFTCYAVAAQADVPAYFMWVRFPYMYVKGGTPLGGANRYTPGPFEIDVSASVPSAEIGAINVVTVNQFGFLVRFSVEVTTALGDSVQCELKWKFVPTP